MKIRQRKSLYEELIKVIESGVPLEKTLQRLMKTEDVERIEREGDEAAVKLCQ